MIGYRGFKRTQRNAGRQDVPLANQLKATREKAQALAPIPSLAGSIAVSVEPAPPIAAGCFGRQPDDRMYSTKRPTEVSYANR